MIYNVQLEQKCSRIDFDECDVKFSVGLSEEEFNYLRSHLLEESEYIKPYLNLLDRGAKVD